MKLQRCSTTTILLAPLFAATCLAQVGNGDHRLVVRQDSYAGRIESLDDIASQLDVRKVRPNLTGSWEDQNLSVSMRVAHSLFRVDLAAPSGVYTLETKTGDVLVAYWDSPGSIGPTKAVWLWNTSEADTLLFQVDPSALQADALAAFLESSVIWSDEHGPTKSVELRARASGTTAGTGAFEGVPVGVDSWWLAAAREGDVAFISVGWWKGTANEDPLGSEHVFERFPPLSLRLKAHSREALFGELGHNKLVGSLRPDPGYRDQIVVGELLSRGNLSDDDVRRLIFPNSAEGGYPSGHGINRRLAALLEALARRREVPKYAAAITELLLTAPADAGVGFDDAMSLLGALFRAGIDPSATALRLLRRDDYVGASLMFLNRATLGPEAIRQLSEAPVPSRYQAQKDRILDAMKKSGGPVR